MSFSQLKSTKSAKSSGKSYVTESPKRANDPATSSLPKADPNVAPVSDPYSDGATVTDSKELYAELPSELEIRKSTFTGRGIWARHSQMRGSVVCAVQPRIIVISTNYLPAHCSTCAGPSATDQELKRCARCRVVHYCSTTCRDADWSTHKLECRALQDWAKEAPSADVAVPSDAVRCIARLLWTEQKEGHDSKWAQEVDAMQSNRKLLQPSAAESHMHLAHSLIRYLGLSSPADLAPFGVSSPGDLVDLLSRFSINTITLSTPSLTPIGLVVSPLVALFNHSCDPNAVVVFPTIQAGKHILPKVHVIALRDIMPGEEITTTYIDTTLPTEIRQSSLQETYHFTCQCNLCNQKQPSIDSLDPRTSIRCPRTCGGFCPYPTEDDPLSRCVKCKAAIASGDSVADAIRVGQDGLTKATTLQTRDPAHALRLTTNLIPILSSAGLRPGSHPLLTLNRLHLSLILASLPSPPDASSLDEAIRTAAKVATGLDEVLPEGHPVRGIARAELGKLLAVDEPSTSDSSADSISGTSQLADTFPPRGSARLALAFGTLQRAHVELCVGFGPGGGEIGRDVHETLSSLEKEIGVWKSGIRNVQTHDTSLIQ